MTLMVSIILHIAIQLNGNRYLAVADAWLISYPGRAAPSHRPGMALSAAPVVCGGIASYAHWMMPHRSACARIRGRYVLRPSGKCRHTSQSQLPSPAVRGNKTGLVMRRPFAFCCMVVPVYVLSCCGRFAAYVGGAFPLTSPRPPSGQVKQRHGRTRPHCHPLPWVNLHPRAPSTGLRPPSPPRSRRDRPGEAMFIRAATPSSAHRSQAAGAVVAWTCSALTPFW